MKHSSLAQLFMKLIQSRPPLAVEAEALRANAHDRAKELGLTTLDLLNRAIQLERSSISASNRAKGAGRPPRADRLRKCGMDATDAGLIMAILDRLRDLGVSDLSRSEVLRLMAKEAIEAELADSASQVKSGERATLLTARERQLKTLFEKPPMALRGALIPLVAALPHDRDGLQEELRLVASRVFGLDRVS